jgi:hypothetical protein
MKAGILLGALLFTCATSTTAAVIVVRSSGPSATQYPTGKSLPDSARVSLRGGDTLVLLDGKGSRTLRGPGSFPVISASGKPAATSFAALIGQGNARRGRVGAVRPVPFPRQLWQASVDSSETFCFVQPASVRLYREDVTAARELSLRNLATGKSTKVSFDERQQIVDWPAGVPLDDGGHYSIGDAHLTAKAVNPGASFADLGSALIQAGCTNQLDLLATATAAAAQ